MLSVMATYTLALYLHWVAKVLILVCHHGQWYTEYQFIVLLKFDGTTDRFSLSVATKA